MPNSVDNELQQIADSLDPVNLGWQTAVGAIAIFVLSLVLARLARKSIRGLASRIDLGMPALFATVARIASWTIIFLGLVGSLRVIGIDFVPLLAGLGIPAVIAAVTLRPFLENFAAGVTLQLQRPVEVGDHI